MLSKQELSQHPAGQMNEELNVVSGVEGTWQTLLHPEALEHVK